jgi:hypothetical protein
VIGSKLFFCRFQCGGRDIMTLHVMIVVPRHRYHCHHHRITKGSDGHTAAVHPVMPNKLELSTVHFSLSICLLFVCLSHILKKKVVNRMFFL